MAAAPTWSRALVTGASSGIGEAYARRLAEAGTDLVLVARRRERLEALSAALGTDAGVQVDVHPADLTDPAELASVEAVLASRDRPVDLLVNNAGFGTTGELATLPVEREDEEIRLNVLALMRLTRAALPAMLEQGRGGIVNVASVAAFQPAPRMATYGGTKAFVLSFTEAVAEEVRGSGVRLQALCPGLTRTEFQTTADYEGESSLPEFVWQTAEQVVAESLTGLERGTVVCVTGAHNKALVVGSALVPRVVRRKIAGLVTRL